MLITIEKKVEQIKRRQMISLEQRLEMILISQIASVLEAHTLQYIFFAANMTRNPYTTKLFCHITLQKKNWILSPDHELKCFQASVCAPANVMIVASVTAEFRQKLVSVVPLCYGGQFAKGSHHGS